MPVKSNERLGKRPDRALGEDRFERYCRGLRVFPGAGAGAELAVMVQPPAYRPRRAVVVDIFLPAAFEAAAIIVAGLLEAADPLAGLVADELGRLGRRRGGESD